ERPIRFEQRSDNYVCPDARPVLAQAPAFFLIDAGSGGDFQLSRRLSAIQILLRIKDREMLSDDLVGGVALDPLGAGVPGSDVSPGVEHEDGVVPDALDHEAEALLAHAERYFG